MKNKLKSGYSDLTLCHSGLRLSTERLVYITHKMTKAFGNCQSQSVSMAYFQDPSQMPLSALRVHIYVM